MKRFLKTNVLRRFTLFLGLSLLLCATIRAQQNEQRIIRTIEELTEALATPSLRSDEPKTYIIPDEGIAVKKEIPVGAGKFILKGGPLYRDENYEGVMLNVNGGGEITIQNTIEGNLDAHTDIPNVLITNGRLILGDGGVFKTGIELVMTKDAGEFILDGGQMMNSLHFISAVSKVQLKSGTIDSGDDGRFLTISCDDVTLDPSHVELLGLNRIYLNYPLHILSALRYDLRIQNNAAKEGDVLIQGAGETPYQLTEADVKHVIFESDEFEPKLQENQIIVAKKVVTPGVITTQEELQAAIDASTGTQDAPAVLTIQEDGIVLTQNIVVNNGKYVTLTGGSIRANFDGAGTMFTVKGTLNLWRITIDGGCTGQEKACWGFRVTGTLALREGSKVTGFGLVSDVSVISLERGYLLLDGGVISDNFFLNSRDRSMCSVIYVKDGVLIMNSGEIINNKGDYRLISFLTSNNDGAPRFYLTKGTISNNEDNYIYIAGKEVLLAYVKGDMNFMLAGGELWISNALTNPIGIHYPEGTPLTDGLLIFKGYESTGYQYHLTQSDIDKIQLPEGYTAVLQDNKAVLKVGSDEPVTNSLQSLIDAAEVGTLENPSVITLTEDVVLSKAIAVKGKHIKLAGGKTISASIANSQSLYMFNVTEKGSLTLDNITLDGTAEGYVSFASVEKDATLQLINGTTLKDAKSKADGVLLVEGNLVMDECVFTNNTIEASYSALIVLGNNSQWTCSNSVIQGNQAYKEVNGKKVYGYVCSTWGQSTIQDCSILENDAYAIHALNTMSLSHVEWKNNMCDIMLVPASLNGHERTYVGAGGEPTTMAIIGEEGVNHLMFSDKVGKKIAVVESGIEGCVIAEGYNGYQLTEGDLAQFTLENKEGYTLLLEDNKIVMRAEAAIINTQAKLQAAIDASKGTRDNPEVITLAGQISISATITIEKKHVLLTGGTLKKAKSGNLNMLYVKDGTLELTNITLDGAQDQFSGYCSFIRANNYGESVIEIGNGALLTNALGGRDRENTLVCANAKLTTLNGGEISGNFVTDGSVVFVDWSRNFVMNSGKITANRRLGGQYLMSIVEVAGYATFNGGTIADNIGNHLSVYHYGYNVTVGGDATIKGEVMIYPNEVITIASPLKQTLTFSFLFWNRNHPTGTAVAKPAEGYTLTENDMSHLQYYTSNVYGLRLEKDSIVVVNLAAENKTFNVKVADVAHGSLTVNKTTAKENDEITVTVTPDEGYKLYSLVYNDSTKLKQAPTGTYIYTFQMPPKDVTISAQFIKNNTTVNEPETENPDKEDPDAIRPGKTIGNLDDLIEALNQGNEDGTTEITPKTKTPTIEDNDPINDEISQAEEDGHEVIGSIEELIHVLNTNSDRVQTSYELTILPTKVTMRLYLPNRLFTSTTLRATDSPYYILNQYKEDDELKVRTIETEYDEESHSVTFETDRLGIFVVMRGTLNTDPGTSDDSNTNPPVYPIIPDKPNDVANAAINGGQPIVYVAGSRIVIEGLGVGQAYAIYDLSGQILKAGVADGSTIYFQPNASSNYVVRYGHSVQIIHYKK